MKHIIEWLIKIEDWASTIYEELAKEFREDDLFYKFIDRLSKDEAMHFHFMSSALICLKKNPNLVTEVLLDQQTMSNVEAPLEKIDTAIKSGTISKTLALESILNSEYSEWNDIFLYVINSLKTNCQRFKVIGPSIQNHLRIIESFLSKTDNGSNYLSKIKKLSPVWKEKVLIVEDSEPVAELLKSIFSKDGDVEIAGNGAEAFDKASHEYYAVIISDIDMPIMGGLEFYEKMKMIYPDAGKRFLFISGAADQKIVKYLEAEKIVFLSKPFQIQEIRQAVYLIIDHVTL